jgi:hypothetical protein
VLWNNNKNIGDYVKTGLFWVKKAKTVQQKQLWQNNMQTYFKMVLNFSLTRNEVKTC